MLEWSGNKRVDYDRSLVFENLWQLYFNRALLTHDALVARGVDVAPGEEPVDAPERYLEAVLANVESADGALTTSVELAPYGKDAVGDVPDMNVRGTAGEYLVDFLGFENPHETVIRPLAGSSRWWHQRDGVVMLWGGGVRHGFDLGTRDIQDVAPTILYLLGAPIADDMDGRVVDDAFTRDFAAERRHYGVPNYSALPRAVAARDSLRGPLEKKLRSLGYIR